MCSFSADQNRGHTQTARAITQIMKQREVTPATSPQLRQEPLEASDAEPREAATLPDVPAVSTGREYFAVPERSRSDGGPVFDSIELAPVAQIDADGTCEAFESLADVPEELRDSVFWSIYGHTSGEGVQCIGDFTTPDHALEVLRRLFGDLKPLR